MYLEFLACLCLLILFLGSGISKIMNFNSVVKMLKTKPFFNMLPKQVTQLALVCAIILLVPGSLVLLYLVFTKTTKKTELHKCLFKSIIVALILFTIFATLIFHNVYIDSSQKHHFMKNLSIVGGLVLMLKLA